MKNNNEKDKDSLIESFNYSKNSYKKNTYPQQTSSNNLNQSQNLQINITHHTFNNSNGRLVL